MMGGSGHCHTANSGHCPHCHFFSPYHQRAEADLCFFANSVHGMCHFFIFG